jgi:hypothetical protein
MYTCIHIYISGESLASSGDEYEECSESDDDSDDDEDNRDYLRANERRPTERSITTEASL